MPLLVALLSFIMIGSLILVIGNIYRQKKQVLSRLQAYAVSVEEQKEQALDPGLRSRILKPLIKRVSQWLSARTPQQAKDGLRKQLLMAGNPGHLQASEFMAVKLLLTVGIFFIMFFLPVSFPIVLVITALSWFAPTLYLRQKVTQRQLAISLAIPDVLDLLTVSVEAGLGFDAAIAKVVEKLDGPLAQEFQRTLHEIRIGKPRRDALRNLSNRTGVAYLQGFVASIIQADQLGVSIGKVLRIQSNEIRRQRRQKAEEAAMKAPVKMLFPLVIFVFPSLFIILLGPALLSILNTL